MRVIEDHGAAEGCRARLREFDRQRRQPTMGRQDKSAAFRRPHVVGRIEDFRYLTHTACWRFSPKAQRFQRTKRHPWNWRRRR